jgi:hypothetical protein
VRKTISTSIVLAEFGKIPFEHFAWGQALLYYNRVSTITNDRILGNAWEAQLIMFVMGKKCWARFVKKMVTQESAPRGGRLFASDSIVIKNGPSKFPPYNVECKKGKT